MTAPGGSNVWAGTAVVGGNVEVEIDGDNETLEASFDVQDRDWRWSQADWSFQQGAAPVLGSSGIPSSDGGVRSRLGYNCTLPDCMRGSIIPDGTVRANWYTFNDTCRGFPVVDLMHRARSAKNPFVAGLIERYVRHDFRLPGPRRP